MNVHFPTFNHSRVISPSGNSSLNNRSGNTIGATYVWSIMGIWKQQTGNTVSALSIVDIATSGNSNRINFLTTNGPGYSADIRNPSNSVIKGYTWNTITGPPILPNTWQHFIATFDGTTLTMYINGTNTTKSSSTTDTTGVQVDGTREVAIGSVFSGASPWTGQISQVAIWNSILSQSEVTDLYNNGGPWTFDLRAAIGNYASQNNLVRWWCCGRNGTYQDMAGTLPLIDLTSSSTLTEDNDVTSESPNLNNYGRFSDYCLDMDGATERLRSTTARTIGIANAWTNLTWVKSLRDTTQETVFEYRSAGTNNDRLRFQKRGDVSAGLGELDIYSSGGSVIEDRRYPNIFPVNQWSGVLATWDGTVLTLWCNGQKVNPSSIATPSVNSMSTTTRQVGWGGGAQIDQLCNCRVYTAATWNTVLSDSECALLTQQNPSAIRWLNLQTNGYGYNSASSLQQWFRAGLGPLVTTSNSAYIVNSGLSATTLPLLTEGASGMTLADIFRDAPA